MLSEKEKKQLFQLYAALYEKAFPDGGKLRADSFELAGFGLSESMWAFEKVGLGLQIVSEYSAEVNHTLVGHTGKVLLNLPWQFMPEHYHADVDILAKGKDVPFGYQKVSERINEFTGIYEYNRDGSIKESNGERVYHFKDTDYTIVMPESFLPSSRNFESLFHFEGKSETFKMVSGEMILFSDDAEILRYEVDPSVVPKAFDPIIQELRQTQTITTKGLIYMTGGTEVLLPKNVKHAILGGGQGAVYIEFSTPSIDEADVFTDERIIR